MCDDCPIDDLMVVTSFQGLTTSGASYSWEILVMGFGLRNALFIFKLLMTHVLDPFRYFSVIVHLDDICIYYSIIIGGILIIFEKY